MGPMRCDIQVLSWFCFAVENQAHCDFVKLRNMLIRTHMHDLKDVTCDVHYENYRAQCIQQMTRWVPHFACGLEGDLSVSVEKEPLFQNSFSGEWQWEVIQHIRACLPRP